MPSSSALKPSAVINLEDCLVAWGGFGDLEVPSGIYTFPKCCEPLICVILGSPSRHYIDYPDDARWDFFYVTVVFTTLFIFELIMRVLAYGRKVFCGSDDWKLDSCEVRI